MSQHNQVSAAAVELVKQFEGYRRASARLPSGGWTIGYGHTQSAREGVEIDEDDAEALLIFDLLKVSAAVSDQIFTPLSDNQFDALVSFAFNVGLPQFRTSNVLRLVNEGSLLEAAAALDSWRKAMFDGDEWVIDALIRRRAAEKALFLTPDEGFVPAPSALIRPTLDTNAIFAEVMRLEPSLEGRVATVHRDGDVIIAPTEPARADQTIVEPVFTTPVDEPPTAVPPPLTLRSPPSESLYDIPGYRRGMEGTDRESGDVLNSLRTPHLLTLALGGAALLLISFTQFLKATSPLSAAGLAPYWVAAFAGLSGAMLLALVVYVFLERMDRGDD